ncbi:MAG: hypothetical protein IPL97_13550 [Niastella sp.]|nr:hypothetical protein [Niastella sp.]
MNKIIYLFAIIFMINACVDHKPENKNENQVVSVKTDESTGLNPTGCGDLIFFKKNAIIGSTLYDSMGNITGTQQMTVTGVKEENGMLIANSSQEMISTTSKTKKPFVLLVAFKCDGKNIYSDPQQALANFSALKDAHVTTSQLAFPLSPEIGEKLPEAYMEMELDRGGMKFKSRTTYTDRHVEGKEQITTAAGSWSCFKILATLVNSINISNTPVENSKEGMTNKNTNTSQLVIWYAPGIGFIKTETYQNEKLQNFSTITSIK